MNGVIRIFDLLQISRQHHPDVSLRYSRRKTVSFSLSTVIPIIKSSQTSGKLIRVSYLPL
jgi:hypothetical protein